jgi:gamma-glutamylcyclotransferase (GGCT)/AIG2-like uncharacterized protein YtfP
VTALFGRVYPGLVPGDTTARGHLLTGLTADEWRVLDAFEDPVYDLTKVDLGDGRHGWTYACNPDATVEDHDWSAEHFQQQHLTAYIERCTAWRQRHEAQQAS